MMIGDTLGSYKILSKLGEGGMGVVYLAEHPLLGRRAAVKVLLPHVSKEPEIVSRFFNEARASTLIKHPGIVDIFDFGVHADGSSYIVMELLDGESLRDRLRRGRLGAEEAIRAVRQCASALAAAHAKGIIHRDLKPDNLFLVPNEELAGGVRLKILDFGIAKLSTPGTPGASDGALKTRTGSVMGSPAYMSPEQCKGAGAVDARADIYSLGCVLFEMVTGRPPFLAEGVGEMIAMHIYEPPPAPRSVAEVSENLDALILRMLAKKPDDRPASMTALIAELDRVSGRAASVAPHAAASVAATIAVGTPVPPPRIALTTLGAGAAELTQLPLKSRRRGLGLLAGAAVLVAGGVTALLATQRSGGPGASPDPAPTPSAATGARPAATVAALPDAGPVAAALPASPDAAPVVVAEPAQPTPEKPRPTAKKPPVAKKPTDDPKKPVVEPEKPKQKPIVEPGKPLPDD